MEELFAFLHQIAPLSEGLVNYLKAHLVLNTFKKREVFLKPGKFCNHIYFLAEGLVRCYYIKDGEEVCEWFFDKGHVVVEVVSWFDRVPTASYLEAMEPTTAYSISYEEQQEAVRLFPEYNTIARILTERYYVLSMKRARMLRGNEGSERLEYLTKFQDWILARVPVKDIASYLGMSPETLSRIRGQKK